MSELIVRLIYAGLFLLAIFLTGFWLNRAGKPYSTALLTVHKLMGLAGGIWLVVLVYRAGQMSSLSAAAVTMTVISVILFIALLATGGVVSAMKQVPPFALLAHHLLPYLAVVSSGFTICLL